MAAVAGDSSLRWRRVLLLFKANGEDEISIAAASYGKALALHIPALSMLS